ncbi:MAG: alpha/beta hydrolase domain-containing protein, partial [Betaproteobacteria bacterium]
GTEPPESQYPRIAEKELVNPKDIRFPFSGGLVRNDTINISADMDFGPRVKFNRGAIDLLVPVVMAGHNVLVPNIDEIGNEIGGIRHPLVEAATNTYLGFNIRQGEFGRGELCDDLGSAIPLASTPAERDDSDHRPALNELYESSTVYLQAVEKATKLLSERGLLLEADARIIKNEAANIALELWGN